jgi:hypothetical protein
MSTSTRAAMRRYENPFALRHILVCSSDRIVGPAHRRRLFTMPITKDSGMVANSTPQILRCRDQLPGPADRAAGPAYRRLAMVAAEPPLVHPAGWSIRPAGAPIEAGGWLTGGIRARHRLNLTTSTRPVGETASATAA